MLRNRLEICLWAILIAVMLVSSAILLREFGTHSISIHKQAKMSPIIEPTPTRLTQPQVVVHVKGAVHKPGVYRFRTGQRVFEAVRAARPTTHADLNQLNLAARLEDGEEIIVPDSRAQRLAAFAANLQSSSSSSKRNQSPYHLTLIQPVQPHKGKAKNLPPRTRININTATAEELELLPGIGPAYSKRILEYRRKRGRFTSIEQLMDIPGIGEKRLERLRPFIKL